MLGFCSIKGKKSVCNSAILFDTMTVEPRVEDPNDQFPIGMRVLAVDDDPTCLMLLDTLLRRCQYHGLILCLSFPLLRFSCWFLDMGSWISVLLLLVFFLFLVFADGFSDLLFVLHFVVARENTNVTHKLSISQVVYDLLT